MIIGIRNIGFVSIWLKVILPADFCASDSDLIRSSSDCTSDVHLSQCKAIENSIKNKTFAFENKRT